ncbi:MAG: hypothetical protein AABZ30_10565 [Myxococcota bacterium]
MKRGSVWVIAAVGAAAIGGAALVGVTPRGGRTEPPPRAARAAAAARDVTPTAAWSASVSRYIAEDQRQPQEAPGGRAPGAHRGRLASAPILARI